MPTLFIPVLSHFENGNPWTASAGRLRCRIVPEPQEGRLTCEIWEGPWSYEYSTVETAQAFPLTASGLASLAAFLEQWRGRLEERPARTLAENIARRDAAEAGRASPKP